jgi:hypothetical protein
VKKLTECSNILFQENYELVKGGKEQDGDKKGKGKENKEE